MRTLYLLWKLARRLQAARDGLAGASINIIVEREDAASYHEACLEARALDKPAPKRRAGWEVTYWPDRYTAQTGAATKRGNSLREALEKALA